MKWCERLRNGMCLVYEKIGDVSIMDALKEQFF